MALIINFMWLLDNYLQRCGLVCINCEFSVFMHTHVHIIIALQEGSTLRKCTSF